MKLIRSLVFPWFVFFVLAVSTILLICLKFPQMQATARFVFFEYLGLGALLCLILNARSLGGVGIWMSESLPESLRYGSWRWIFRALKSVAVAAIFWYAGRLSWVPLIWHAAVVPFIFTVCLFVAVWSLLGPILKWSSNLAWSRAFSIILSLPVLTAIPLTALFVGQTMVFAYRASHAQLTEDSSELNQFNGGIQAVAPQPADILKNDPFLTKKSPPEKSLATAKKSQGAALGKGTSFEGKVANSEKKRNDEISDEALESQIRDSKDIRAHLDSIKPQDRALAFRYLAGHPEACPTYTKETQNALDPKGPKDVVFWAIQASECAGIRLVIALPKLTQIMAEHSDPRSRAAAIYALKRYGDDHVRQISYLLAKRLTENEPGEVIEATASLLAPLGGDQVRWSTNRLKGLLNSNSLSTSAAQALIRYYGRDDLIVEYVANNLDASGDARRRAVDMICLLPQGKRSVAEPHIAGIVTTINTADQEDPGLKALGCLGKKGFEIIRTEMGRPQQLQKPVAARALAEMDLKNIPESLEITARCARDENAQVRSWCSQGLGKIGAPALPQILDLLESSNKTYKEAGHNALRFFDDLNAKDDLQRVVNRNSGWMANARKLQIAKAVNTTLSRLEVPAEKTDDRKPSGQAGDGQAKSKTSAATKEGGAMSRTSEPRKKPDTKKNLSPDELALPE